MERRTVSAPELKAQIEAERAGRPFLVFRDGQGEQVIREIAADAELWVGRAASADVHLEWDEEVSALHAQIEVVRGECTLVDDGLSRNGSFVNEERVHGRRHLRDGDALRFGQTVVVYRRPGENPPEATVPPGQLPAAATISPPRRRRGKDPPASPLREARRRRPPAEPKTRRLGRTGATDWNCQPPRVVGGVTRFTPGVPGSKRRSRRI